MSEHQPRLRRSTRQAAKIPTASVAPAPGAAANSATGNNSSPLSKAKRKGQVLVDQEKWIRSLLQDPKSIITSIDISDVFNASVWSMLSEESCSDLKQLLPPTAFVGYRPRLGHDHPAAQADMDVDPIDGAGLMTGEVDDLGLFTDPHFLSAARTFQDHLFSNWLSDAHQEKVAKFEADLRSGSLAVRWKDEQWLEDNPPIQPEADTGANILGRTASWDLTLAGGATQIKLATLVENGIVRVGDVLAYRRVFASTNLIIEKDVLVDSIHPSTRAVTVLAVLGPDKDLPEGLVARENAGAPTDPTTLRSMTISSPSMLESALLDMDGRLDKGHRPNGNAWKCFSVWRWRTAPGSGGDGEIANGRGGRDNHGTLFYLRGNHYHEGPHD
ncbi:hypothetical protein FA13DRAFT_1728100 [Coprinellus micaceus]|uniref:ASX DEUBAD domain-containing protein n=1 Tax=Coprinellus micaceus TaxID=71717 RepID=A0A4Y7TM77_COPMI|nr:hypothetical protein FA13DRAFT_1728100 [Coprinellus micaceus]